MSTAKNETFANPAVLEFYKSFPFNYRESADESLRALRETDPVNTYPVLIPYLGRGVRVLEVGCGTGWLANSIAYRYRSQVTAIDFNPVAIARASEVGRAAGLNTEFRVEDLFLYEPEDAFDVVISIGVLHHTDNCHAAVRRCFKTFVRPGGHVLIGLYHFFGRRPFLDHFAAMRRDGATEEEMFARYRQLHAQLKDETHLRSWFRDQVLHPHESQHTLEEMLPILKECGMELIATSINRFQPIESVAALVEEEKSYERIAIQRLTKNQYFPGFFVFLVRREHGKNLETRSTARFIVGDTKPYVSHHPVIGYHYIPNVSQTLPAPDGGTYTIRINSAGIRSDREYSRRKLAGTFRILVFGDSMSAGQFINNQDRFSEILERRIPNLEVINLSLEGSGTDQQLLVLEQIGTQYDFDLILLFPFLQNIRRNMADGRESRHPVSGEPVILPKPRFKLANNELVLCNVPVPLGRFRVSTMNGNAVKMDSGDSLLERVKTSISGWPGTEFMKRMLYTVKPWEPFPEYRDPNSPQWRLMEAIIRRFKVLAGTKPLVIIPTFYANYVRLRMARNYLDRYQSLATGVPGIHVIDLLPHLKQLRGDAVSCFQEPYDMHFSKYGNLILARILEAELSRLNLLPTNLTSQAFR